VSFMCRSPSDVPGLAGVVLCTGVEPAYSNRLTCGGRTRPRPGATGDSIGGPREAQLVRIARTHTGGCDLYPFDRRGLTPLPWRPVAALRHKSGPGLSPALDRFCPSWVWPLSDSWGRADLHSL